MADQPSNRQSWASAGPSSHHNSGSPQMLGSLHNAYPAASSTTIDRTHIGDSRQFRSLAVSPPTPLPQAADRSSGTTHGRKRQPYPEVTGPSEDNTVASEFSANNSGANVSHSHKRTKLSNEFPMPGVPIDDSFVPPQAQLAGPVVEDSEPRRSQSVGLHPAPQPQTSRQPPVHPHHTTSIGSVPTNNVHHVEFGNFGTNFGTQIFNSGSVLWDTLPRQRGTSGHRSKYLEGSRDEDVTEIRNWVETASSELVLWVYGPAGLGKSTLAREVSRDLRMADLLGAFIPLCSLPNDARDPESVIKVIAREIGETYPQAIPAITNAISICKGTPVENHLRVFVGKTVRSLRRASPVAVILDAFDEWEFSGVLIKDLTCLASLSSIVRFILLGRSDPKSLGHQSPFTRPYCLQPVSTTVMERYFDREFEGVAWDFGRKPSDMDVSRLAEQADGLFIWASTACSLLGNGRGLMSPNETLEGILYSRKRVGETGHLGTLYGGALQWLFPEEDEQGALRRYLGMILILQEPLPLDDFSSFSGLSSRSVHMMKTRLGALHIRNTVDTRPTIHPATTSFHLSFIEYLQHESTATRPTSFATPRSSFHLDLAKACLQELAAALPVPQNLSRRQWYAAKHWVSHASEGAPAVKPRSSSDWEATELCSVLTGISTTTWGWWRKFILGFFIPGHVVEEVSGGGGVGDFLQDIAESLDERNPTMIPFIIACLSVATCLQPDSVCGWCDLGWAYFRFAEVSSSRNLLDRAVTAYETAVTAGGGSDSIVVGGLGMALNQRFLRLGVTSDLDQSILLLGKALTLCPSGHPDRPSSLCNLANSLTSRFRVTNSFDDLQEAIVLEKEALALRPSGHPNRPMSLCNLANSLSSRFKVTNSLGALQEAIALGKEALALCPSGHPDRSTSLGNLAASLYSRFKVTNSLDDLQEAIALEKEALALRPSGHPNRPMSLCNLAASLYSRFKVTNSLDDLQEAIALEKEALALRPSGHPNRPMSLCNLAASLSSRFKVTNSLDDLQEAIVLEKEALALRPSGHPDRSSSLCNLANSLNSRFGVTNSLDNLQEAIVLQKEALALCPSGHPDRSSSLCNLANSLSSRFEVTNSFDDLQEAIVLEKEALALRPAGHPDRTLSLCNLAVSLTSRFEVTNSFDDLQEAIVLEKEALALCPSGHPDRSFSLNNLGDSLLSRFNVKNSFDDLQQAIILFREALVLRPPGHVYRSTTLRNLARALESRSQVTGSVEDMDEASALRQEFESSRVQ